MCLIALIAVAAAVKPVVNLLSPDYKAYCKAYNKVGTVEGERVFIQNMAKIDAHNQGDHGWKMGQNQFTDMSEEQLKSFKGEYPDIRFEDTPVLDVDSLPQDVPASWDWRQHGAVNPIKDQGQCGTCWTFASTSAVESASKIDLGTLPNLSESQQADCDKSGGCNECAFKWLQTNKPCTEASFPYKCPDSRGCIACTAGAPQIQRFTVVQQSNETALKIAVYNRPVAIGIAASGDFMGYRSGVFSGSCPGGRDHAVVLVGYGTDNGKDYWILRNSWNTGWGEQGYMRIARGGHGADGICLIATDPSTPFFK